MNCSVEMKLQTIDKMLAMREQLIVMQNNLGMSTGVGISDKILIFRLEDLQELSKATGNKMYETGYVSDSSWVEVALEYKGVVFNTYLPPNKYKAYKDGDESGGKND